MHGPKILILDRIEYISGKYLPIKPVILEQYIDTIVVKKNGVVLSTTFIKLGLLVPMVVSVVLFKEMPTILQITGFVITILAIILMNYEKKFMFRDLLTQKLFDKCIKEVKGIKG